MSIDMDAPPKLGYQAPAAKDSVRIMSDQEAQEARREQDIARRKANIREKDKDLFLLEYLRYRGTKASQSPVRMAQIMAKTKADNLSKTSGEENTSNSEKGALQSVAEKLGVSVEQLTITLDGVEGDPAGLSGMIKDLAGMVSRKAVYEKYERRMPGEGQAPKGEAEWAASLKKRAGALEAAADALEKGSVTTGKLPGAASLRERASLCRRLAGWSEPIPA